MTEPSPLEAIFFAALHKGAPPERAAYLDEACAGDPDLRRRVEKMLAAQAQAGSFLERPVQSPVATVDEPTTLEQPGTVIGSYRLLEQVGEGGMGLVFVAEQQQPVRRKVALKVLKPGMDTRQVIARFEAERQALALMDHPNIARVFDGGSTPAGRPYFVMELVKGLPVTEYCDRNSLPVRERLKLFVDVCAAVQHAHQKGVIHRDLKPSNVMVVSHDGTPVAKVIDFGIAKATGQQLTERTLVTGFGAVIGTLEYMSPEQAELNQLDIDTRSDIYSLGVLLYELLTGSTPLEKKRLKEAALLEVLRVIREQEPPRPSTRLLESQDTLPTISAQRQTEPAQLIRLVRGEVDWIVMKALDKDRNRRYETASAFGTDVQRYLQDEPVQACPPSAWYRFRKFTRRNRSALAVAGLILLVIVLAGGGGGWVLRDRAVRQARAANDLELALERAEFFQRKGERADALAAVSRAELLAGEAPPDPGQEERLGAVKERLAAESRDQEFIRRYEAVRLDVQGQFDFQAHSFNLMGGLPEYRDALARFGIAVGVLPPSEAAARIRGRPEPARGYLAAALDECLRYSPKQDEVSRKWLLTVLKAADGDPWRVRARQAVAAGDRDEIERLARDVDARSQPPSFLVLIASSIPNHPAPTRLKFLRRVRHAHQADLWANFELGYELQLGGRKAEAVRYFTAAVALRPDNPSLLASRGVMLAAAGDFDEAIADLRRSIELAPNYMTAWTNLSSTLERAGHVKEGLDASRKAVEIDPKEPLAWANLAHAHALVHEFQKALDDCDEALKLDPNFVLAWVNRGNVYLRLGRFDETITACNEALRLDRNLSVALSNRGAAYAELGRYDKSLEDCSAAIKLQPGRAEHHYALGGVLEKVGRQQESIAAYREAIKLRDNYPEAHSNLAIRLVMVGQFAEALAHFRRAEEISSKIPGGPYPTVRMRRSCERLVELDQRLPAFLDGSALPAGAGERIELATMCTYKRHYLSVSRFFADAFSDDPKLADDLRAGHRYNGACAVALAGVGQSQDGRDLDDEGRARLREQALDWLRADLEAWGRRLDKEPDQPRPHIIQILQHWLKDTDFSGVRGSEALTRLPETERQAWQKLWADVADTLARAQGEKSPKQ
jgi:serine/threonine protein kinase/tetratricopeptide (TPR) repeat protein